MHARYSLYPIVRLAEDTNQRVATIKSIAEKKTCIMKTIRARLSPLNLILSPSLLFLQVGHCQHFLHCHLSYSPLDTIAQYPPYHNIFLPFTQGLKLQNIHLSILLYTRMSITQGKFLIFKHKLICMVWFSWYHAHACSCI